MVERVKDFRENMKYRQVRRILEKEIVSGAYKVDEPLPTDEDLADELEVARGTVRRAMQELVDDGIIERVRGRGSFIIPRQPVHLTKNIGVSFSGGVGGLVFSGAAGVLAKRGYFPMAMNYLHGDVDGEAKLIREMAELGASGFLVFPACQMRGEHLDNSALFAEISASGRAVVTVDKILPEYKVSAVVCDHEAIELEMVEYLARQNVRRIVYIGSADGYIAFRRYDEMITACKNAGLEFAVDTNDIRFHAGQGYYPAAYVSGVRLGQICKSGAEAVACYSPQMAAGILDGLKNSPYTEGNRIKYVLTPGTPDDAAMLKDFAVDGVETVMIQNDPVELAKQAAEILLEHIENGVLAEPVIKKLQPHVIKIESKRPNVPHDWHEY
jgi:DNA-binding LacI/PurR family transcriptional regulator